MNCNCLSKCSTSCHVWVSRNPNYKTPFSVAKDPDPSKPDLGNRF